MSRTTRAAKGFATSLFQYLFQILLQIVLAPVVLHVAGRETLGAFAAIVQVLALLQLVDIAGSWSLERFLAQAMGQDPSGKRFRDVFTTARMLFLITNTAFALLVLLFSFFIGHILHLSPHVDWQARWALRVIAVWAVLRTPLAAYLNASIAMQDLAATNLISALVGALRSIASLTFVLAGGGLFGLMLAGTVAEASGYILYRVRFRKVNPQLMPGWGIPDRALLREMVNFGGHAMFLNIGNVLIARTGNILAGITSGAAMASTFYTSQTPAMTAYVAIQRFADSASPAVNELYGRGEMVKVGNALRRVTSLVLALTLPLAVGIILFNRDVVVTWVGALQYAGTLLTVTIALFCATFAVQQIAIVYAFVFGWVRLLSISAFLQGIAYFGLSLWLGRRLGLGGITLSLVCVVIPQNVILWKRLGAAFGFSASRFLAMRLVRSLIPLACAAGASWFVHLHVVIRRHHLPGLLAECLTFALVCAPLVYFLYLDPIDRNDARRYSGSALRLALSLPARFRRTSNVA